MPVDENAIRAVCTDAVYQRGENYRAEGRIRRLTRVDDTVTATVRGSRVYDLTLNLAAERFDPRCSCPYDRPGACKHVVAVLLELADGLPPDDGTKIDAILDDVQRDDLRAFVRDELVRDPAMRERFVAEFGDAPTTSAADYRAEIDRLFEEHTDEYPVVVEAIDFSRFTDLAERHCERGNYRQAAAIYRAIAEGIDENMNLVDAAYDHYAQVFRSALDEYVTCVSTADLDVEAFEAHAEFLSERTTSAPDSLREHYEAALHDLRSRENSRDR